MNKDGQLRSSFDDDDDVDDQDDPPLLLLLLLLLLPPNTADADVVVAEPDPFTTAAGCLPGGAVATTADRRQILIETQPNCCTRLAPDNYNPSMMNALRTHPIHSTPKHLSMLIR